MFLYREFAAFYLLFNERDWKMWNTGVRITAYNSNLSDATSFNWGVAPYTERHITKQREKKKTSVRHVDVAETRYSANKLTEIKFLSGEKDCNLRNQIKKENFVGRINDA